MARIRPRRTTNGGVRYCVEWVLGGGSAKAGARTQTETFSTENRAMAFKLDVENAGNRWPPGWIKGEGYVPVEATVGETLDDVSVAYFAAAERRVTRGRLKAYTLHRYRRSYALHGQDVLGGLAFKDIHVDEIEDWIDEELGAGAAPKSIRNRHGLLYSIFAHGEQRMKLRPDNPCTATELPQVDHRAARQIRFFTRAEWDLFRANLREDVLLLCDVLLATGMRWGEIAALRVGDVSFTDADEVVLHIVRAWSSRAPDDLDPIDTDAGEAKKWKLGPPKSRKTRYVVVSGPVAARLRDLVEGRDESEYVFRRKVTPWRYEDFHYERWRPAVRATNVHKRLTPHMLRHTFVVWALAEGVRIEQVSEMLGHASIQITYDIYGGLLDLRDPTAARALARRMAVAPAEEGVGTS